MEVGEAISWEYIWWRNSAGRVRSGEQGASIFGKRLAWTSMARGESQDYPKD